MYNMVNSCNIERHHIDTFLSKIEKTESCWNWIGLSNPQGYGRIVTRRKEWRTNRFSWGIHNGDIPDGMLVCHKCDNPRCVNPNHLFLGTYKDNAIDRNRKNRHRDDRGEKHPCAKLSDAQVIDIRDKLRKGIQGKELAKAYGVCKMTISNIKLGKKWRHLI